jgi:thiol-disulfide isomerase/thioredoxin
MTTFRSKKWWRLPAACLAVLAIAVVAILLKARSFDGAVPPSLLVNAGLPVKLPDGKTVTLGHLLRPNRPTVVNLWASWCGPCRREAPTVVDLHQRFGTRINLIYLNVLDESASREDLAGFLTQVGLPKDGYVIMDSSHIAALTGAADNFVPRTLVFDRAGAPLARITGYKPLALARVAGLVDQ